MNGFAFLAVGGTPKICCRLGPIRKINHGHTHMREDLFCEPSPFRLFKCCIEADNSSAALQTVSSHLEFVHCVDVLHVHFDTGTIRRLGSPHVQIFMSPSFEVQSVIAVVEISELGE